MIRKNIHINGLEHYNLSIEDLKFLCNDFNIILELDPLNIYDENAIKCKINEIHFGYIEQYSSYWVSALLEQKYEYKVEILVFKSTSLYIRVEFTPPPQN